MSAKRSVSVVARKLKEHVHANYVVRRADFCTEGKSAKCTVERISSNQTESISIEFNFHCYRYFSYPASRGFFPASLLACTKSFTSLVFRVVSLFTSPR